MYKVHADVCRQRTVQTKCSRPRGEIGTEEARQKWRRMMMEARENTGMYERIGKKTFDGE